MTVQPPLQAADFCRVLHKMSVRFSLSKTLKNGSAVMCWHLTCCTLRKCLCVCAGARGEGCVQVCVFVYASVCWPVCVHGCMCVFTSVCVRPRWPPSHVAVKQNRVADCLLLCLLLCQYNTILFQSVIFTCLTALPFNRGMLGTDMFSVMLMQCLSSMQTLPKLL